MENFAVPKVASVPEFKKEFLVKRKTIKSKEMKNYSLSSDSVEKSVDSFKTDTDCSVKIEPKE